MLPRLGLRLGSPGSKTGSSTSKHLELGQGAMRANALREFWDSRPLDPISSKLWEVRYRVENNEEPPATGQLRRSFEITWSIIHSTSNVRA